jgi:GT2 family glycosyltransferase/glycosyltransferase involved in cell wall biosynthesis
VWLFWDIAIEPVLEAVRPGRILEIGVDRGLTTGRLVDYAEAHGNAVIEAVDVDPKLDTETWERKHPEAIRFHRGLSLDVLPGLDPVDVALIDGDHNWYTVRNELRLLEEAASPSRPPPVILLHDVGWPYARRDLYYDPDTVPDDHRHPFKRGGIQPGAEGVSPEGFNAHLYHATTEGGARNGVRTAVEDFLADSEREWRLAELPGGHGLGVLAPAETVDANGRLRDVLDGFRDPDLLVRVAETLERERIATETRRQRTAAAHETAAGERDSLAARVRDAEAKAASPAAADVERLKQELGGARDELRLARDEARAAQDDAETARAEARRAVDEARDRGAVAERAQDDAKRRVGAITQELEQERDRLGEEKRARQETEGQLLERIREHAEAVGRLAARERELEVVSRALDDARQVAAHAAEEARTARADAEEAERKAQRVARQLADQGEREDELEGALKDARRMAEQAADARTVAEAELGELRREQQALRRELDAATTQMQRATSAGDELQSAHDALQAQLAERDRELEDVAGQRRRLAGQLEEQRADTDRRLDEAGAQLESLRQSARELEERLEARELDVEALEDEVRDGRRQLAEARKDLDREKAEQITLEARAAILAAERDAALAQSSTRAAVGPEEAAPPTGLPSPPAPASDEERAAPASALERMSEPEREAYAAFLREYPPPPVAPGAAAIVDSTALPVAVDRQSTLVEEHPANPDQPTVDVIVCVHNALDDVRLCLWSVLEKSAYPLRLVVVNDGSDAETTEYLRATAGQEPAIHLIENLSPPHGYTVAANLGMKAATGDYLILLNSDTIVTTGWIDRIVACGESDPAIGVLGPLSNAASHQSLPELRGRDGWSTNPLPPFANPDGIAALLARVSPRSRPRFPFINGFCYVIKRAVIDTIGYFDEDLFASGYCEENDFSVRAGDAGFELAVVDDGYVYHAKSKSFSPEGRRVIAKRNYEIFLDKHGRERINEMVAGLENDRALAPLRSTVGDALSSDAAFAYTLELADLRIVFVLPGLGAGGSGGSHSIYQEVKGLRDLGLDAWIALAGHAQQRARDTYDDADEIFHPFETVDELAHLTRSADVISATHFKSAALVAELRERRADFLPAYYVQDYEPFFTSRNSEDTAEAIQSYTLIPGCLLFAKTHWLCNIVAARHDVYVAKVEPSIDERVYRPSAYRHDGGPIRISAMIRPRTPRRQPTATVEVLEEIIARFGKRVRVTTFGCPQAELERFTEDQSLLRNHRALLARHDVAELLGESDVFLDMSMYQAFGRTALEAMACGSTAVVPRLGGVWEFLEHRGNGLAIDTMDSAQAVQAVAELVEDENLLRTMQARALETGGRYSVLRASLSEYAVFAREHARRFGEARAIQR